VAEPAFALFEVVGLEVEHAVVDADLRPRCLVGKLLRELAGRPATDAEIGGAGVSNELAAHVLELKNPRPRTSLVLAERDLAAGVQRVSDVLASSFGARLLPTGMHPLMSPEDTELWSGAGRRVYETYASLFSIREHGWLNVQSCHVNLPDGRGEDDAVDMHDACAMLLPYLPAIAASSPVVEGRLGPRVDNRLAHYRRNQRSVPVITGRVVPEYMGSLARYAERVHGAIARELRSLPGGRTLNPEWVNSRGVIPRPSRQAFEIRVLDVQECVKMDVAIAAFTRAALRRLVRELREWRLERPPHAMLVRDYDRVVRAGRAARVAASHLRGRRRSGEITARAVLESLLERVTDDTPPDERPYLDLVARRVEHGNLSELIARRLRRAPSARTRRALLVETYLELAERLVENEPWDG
jgi:gamma-glutamyl:cysteine ligase YbdK (ATP-grasp superfamily)